MSDVTPYVHEKACRIAYAMTCSYAARSVKDIAARLELSESTVGRTLQIMRDLDLVAYEVPGKNWRPLYRYPIMARRLSNQLP